MLDQKFFDHPPPKGGGALPPLCPYTVNVGILAMAILIVVETLFLGLRSTLDCILLFKIKKIQSHQKGGWALSLF